MPESNFCNDCVDKDSCQSIYKVVGSRKGSGVLKGVLLAFLLPMILFIMFVWSFGKILSFVTGSEFIISIISFLAAVLLTLISVISLKKLCRV